jgi:hypothetical protein
MITLALLAAMALHPLPPFYNWPEPPEQIIDFLGRRRLCRELPEPADRRAGDEREWRRLNCASLPDEERSWRARYETNAGVRLWLDQDPREFRLPRIVVSSNDGPPRGDVHRMEVTGVSYDDGSPFRLSIDTEAGDGRYTSFTASFAGLPDRVFMIDNARFPYVDLQSLEVAFGRSSPNERLILDLRYGYPRDYCSDAAFDDDRPGVIIYFSRAEPHAYHRDMTNCGYTSEDLPNAPSP